MLAPTLPRRTTRRATGASTMPVNASETTSAERFSGWRKMCLISGLCANTSPVALAAGLENLTLNSATSHTCGLAMNASPMTTVNRHLPECAPNSSAADARARSSAYPAAVLGTTNEATSPVASLVKSAKTWCGLIAARVSADTILKLNRILCAWSTETWPATRAPALHGTGLVSMVPTSSCTIARSQSESAISVMTFTCRWTDETAAALPPDGVAATSKT
eukprot:Amastigsp_a511227_22.p3 type:complete len:221 gc:universal Amastigsp_a511227_22:841-179(-)